ALPAADGMAHVRVVGWRFDLVEMDRARGARELVRHLDLVRALYDLEGVGHVHRARDARQVALELRVAIDPVLAVLLLDLRGVRRVRDLPVALHDADRPR